MPHQGLCRGCYTWPMTDLLSRRAMLVASVCMLPERVLGAQAPFAALEKQSGARIGVAALDTASGRRILWRAHERFLMCSTFKLSLAAAILMRADHGADEMDRLVHYRKDQLLDVSPATSRNVDHGMTVAGLCEAAVIYSDNTAANLLLARLGGPGALTRFWRDLGDTVSRLDKIEPALNLADGDKDTTAPAAMLANLQTMLLGEVLSVSSRARLLGWMEANTTGQAMLRAGLPTNWVIGDKTGRWNGHDRKAFATNDLAIATPPQRKPILMACFTQAGPIRDDARPAIIASVARILAEIFA
jgi:beta-lactamase class A